MRAKTVRHRVDFDGLVEELESPTAWDTIRTQGPQPYAFPDTQSGYVEYAESFAIIADRARGVAPLLNPPVASYGVGTGLLEWHLARLGVEITVTEHGRATVAKLNELTGLRAVEHDLLADEPLPAATHLMHRVDASFTRRQWRRILRRYGRVVFIPGAMTDSAGLKAERKRSGVPAGWLRNERAIERLWPRTHTARRIQAHDLPGWLLARR